MNTRTRLKGYERESVVQVIATEDLLGHSAPMLEQRLRGAGAWRPFRQAMGLLRKADKAMLMSVDEAQLRAIYNELKISTVEVRRRRGLVQTPDYMLVSVETLDTLVRTVLKDTCELCTKSVEESKHCKVRAALDDLPTECKYSDHGCPYMVPEMERLESVR